MLVEALEYEDEGKAESIKEKLLTIEESENRDKTGSKYELNNELS